MTLARSNCARRRSCELTRAGSYRDSLGEDGDFELQPVGMKSGLYRTLRHCTIAGNRSTFFDSVTQRSAGPEKSEPEEWSLPERLASPTRRMPQGSAIRNVSEASCCLQNKPAGGGTVSLKARCGNVETVK